MDAKPIFSQATRKGPRKTLDSARLKSHQRLHAVAVSSLSLLGCLAALTLVCLGRPPGAVEVGLFLGGFLFTGFGVNIGLHRHFTHRSFQAVTPVRVALAILGSMAAQGPVVFWVALHRLHHEFSDQPGDIHSPHFHGEGWWGSVRGLWHAHVGWTFDHAVPNAAYYAGDLLRDRAIAPISRTYFFWVFLGLLIAAVLGGVLTGTWMGALTGFLWGGPVRIFCWHNMIWSITSCAHFFGERPFDADDRSTNNFWFAIPTLGESWHNNHHAFPNAAMAGLEWWQIDPSGWVIRALEKLGLVWDVKIPTQAMRRAKARAI
ncbi:acyl-CoA desaturase [Gloeobacter morelensis]|uniref:Acyl-CoA desaturase n=1 Tax=Gloeobacter morelensis MG652769 TaxID=2781736 RepID=A0ABY3PM17_9CYAN|nr:acyl-CoA desaturase [Gloeobacter morelensis]UFP94723.1 acyl-CoA desaturase [Gloeobacter morelensis MG652769]